MVFEYQRDTVYCIQLQSHYLSIQTWKIMIKFSKLEILYFAHILDFNWFIKFFTPICDLNFFCNSPNWLKSRLYALFQKISSLFSSITSINNAITVSTNPKKKIRIGVRIEKSILSLVIFLFISINMSLYNLNHSQEFSKTSEKTHKISDQKISCKDFERIIFERLVRVDCGCWQVVVELD